MINYIRLVLFRSCKTYAKEEIREKFSENFGLINLSNETRSWHCELKEELCLGSNVLSVELEGVEMIRNRRNMVIACMSEIYWRHAQRVGNQKSDWLNLL